MQNELYWKSTAIANSINMFGIEEYREMFIIGTYEIALNQILNSQTGNISCKDIICYLILRSCNLFENVDNIRIIQDKNKKFMRESHNCSENELERLKLLCNAYEMYDKDIEEVQIISLYL